MAIDSDDEFSKLTKLADVREKILSDKATFLKRAMPDDHEEISSKEEGVEWCHKYYATLLNDGQFSIINSRVPGTISFMTRKAFIESIEDKRILETGSDGNSKSIAISGLWLRSASPHKHRYLQLVFDASKKFDPNSFVDVYNLWRGLFTEARQGDCSLTKAYIKDIIASGDEKSNDWVLDLLAHMVQKPYEKPEVALVLKGLKGVGKTFLMDIIQQVVDGPQRQLHCFKTANSEDIYGSHRSHLKGVIALLLEEVSFGGDIRHENVLKDLITGKTITINIKFGPVITVKNLMRVIMAANPGWSVPASHDERRYTVLLVSDKHKEDHDYFAAIDKELVTGGYEALMYELMNRDISKFNCREALITDELIDQKIKSMSDIEKWWLKVLRKGQIKHLTSKTEDGWICVGRQVLYEEYVKNMKKLGVRNKLLGDDEFSIALRQLLPKRDDNGKIIMGGRGRAQSVIGMKRVESDGTKVYCHLFPPLDTCRELMEFRLKRNMDWDEPVEWEQPEYDIM